MPEMINTLYTLTSIDPDEVIDWAERTMSPVDIIRWQGVVYLRQTPVSRRIAELAGGSSIFLDAAGGVWYTFPCNE